MGDYETRFRAGSISEGTGNVFVYTATIGHHYYPLLLSLSLSTLEREREGES
jgi:hypothetical protein